MEYRTWTSVADVPFGGESKWLPLTNRLERKHPELGPVVTWQDNATTIVLILTSDEPDPATAAENAARVVSNTLHAADLADHFPTVFRVEPATDLVPAWRSSSDSETQSASCW
jgi:hypothetical protein